MNRRVVVGNEEYGIEYEVRVEVPKRPEPTKIVAQKVGSGEWVRDPTLLMEIVDQAALEGVALSDDPKPSLKAPILGSLRKLKERVSRVERALASETGAWRGRWAERLTRITEAWGTDGAMGRRLAAVEAEWPGVGRVKQYGEVVMAIQRELSRVLDRVQRVEDELVDKTLVSLDGRAASLNAIQEQTSRDIGGLRLRLENLERRALLEEVMADHGGGAEGRAEPAK